MQQPRALRPIPDLAPALLACLLLAPPAGAEIVERVVAKVNGQAVTLSEFEGRQIAAVQSARIPPAEVEEYLRQNNARILQEAIDDLLLVQRGEELGFKLRGDYLDEVVEGIKKDNNIATDEELAAQLRREGMTVADLKRNLEHSIVRRQVLARELEAKAQVTEADLRAEYEANLKSYDVAASVDLSEILVLSESGSPALAQELARRARAGEDFATLARQYSAAPSAAGGGSLGTVHKGDLSAELEKVAFSLAEGAVSEPFPAPRGFRIFKAVKQSEGRRIPFEEVKEEIRKRVAQARGAREYEKYMEGLRKNAIIDVRVREVPLQVAAPPVPTLVPPAPAGGRPGAPPAPPTASSTTRPAESEEEEAPAGPAAGEEEFTVSPQAKPERVAPGDDKKKDEPKTP